MRLGFCWLAFMVLISIPMHAQESARNGVVSDTAYGEIRDHITEIEARIKTMNSVARDRDDALRYLDDQVGSASQTLSSGRDENSGLRQENIDLEVRIEGLVGGREDLEHRLKVSDAETSRLLAKLSALEEKLLRTEDALSLAEKDVATFQKELDTIPYATIRNLMKARGTFLEKLGYRYVSDSNVRVQNDRLVMQSDRLFEPEPMC